MASHKVENPEYHVLLTSLMVVANCMNMKLCGNIDRLRSKMNESDFNIKIGNMRTLLCKFIPISKFLIWNLHVGNISKLLQTFSISDSISEKLFLQKVSQMGYHTKVSNKYICLVNLLCRFWDTFFSVLIKYNVPNMVWKLFFPIISNMYQP